MGKFYTADDFREMIDRAFEIDPESNLIEMSEPFDLTLTLIACKDLKVNEYPGRKRDPFSLLFRSSPRFVLPQRIYALQNEAMGTVELFLVPLQRTEEGTIYQAVFT